MQNLVYEWVDFSKFGQIWAKIGSNLRKFWRNMVILFKIWPKIGPISIWMGYFFLKNWYLYGSTFKFHGGTSLPKPNLSTPPGPRANVLGGWGYWASSTSRLKIGSINQEEHLFYTFSPKKQKHKRANFSKCWASFGHTALEGTLFTHILLMVVSKTMIPYNP